MTPPFRADHVGSLLRPPALLAAREQHAAGILDAAGLRAVEDADALKRRIDEAAKYVPLDRLSLSPQCGFSSTVEGDDLTVDEQKAKPALIVRVADEVWA